MKKILLIAVPVVVVIIYGYTTAAVQSSCVVCHTNENILKKLCRPFQAPAGEGEG